MTNKTCLNCDKVLTDKFCSRCGQKADTHRISFKNFVFHDVLHGTFHIERGMLFTAKQSLIRPGQAALDVYFREKKRYYNVFLLIWSPYGSCYLRAMWMNCFTNRSVEIVPRKFIWMKPVKNLDELFSQKARSSWCDIYHLQLWTVLFYSKKKLNMRRTFYHCRNDLTGHFIYRYIG